MSTIPVESAENKAERAISEYAHRAKSAYVPRPSFPGNLDKGKGWERSIIAKATRLPRGLTLARNEGVWYSQVRNSPIMHRRQDCVDNMLAVVRSLINLHRRKSKTVAATWAEISKMAQVSVSTVKRTLAELRTHGLLATVASGRSATKGETQNWAPVYMLTYPQPQKLSKSTDRPSHLKESNTSLNARAYAKISYDQRNRKEFVKAYQESKGNFGKKSQAPGSSSLLSRKKAYEQAVRCLQNHAYALRGLTVKAILQETKPAFQQGWTVADVLKALEERPNGEIWNTSGAGGMKSIQAWLRIRLAAWRDTNGSFLPSHSQKREQDYQRQQLERAKARQEDQAPQKNTVAAPSWFAEYRKLLKLGKKEAAKKLLKDRVKG